MHISRIYIQDNFVPDFDTDPFRRKVFGMEVTINEGENAGDGIADLEKRISEYITANTIPPTHSMRGVQERIINEPPQPDSITSTLNEIDKCKDMTELSSLWLISKGNLTLSSAYKAKEKQLNNAK